MIYFLGAGAGFLAASFGASAFLAGAFVFLIKIGLDFLSAAAFSALAFLAAASLAFLCSAVNLGLEAFNFLMTAERFSRNFLARIATWSSGNLTYKCYTNIVKLRQELKKKQKNNIIHTPAFSAFLISASFSRLTLSKMAFFFITAAYGLRRKRARVLVNGFNLRDRRTTAFLQFENKDVLNNRTILDSKKVFA